MSTFDMKVLMWTSTTNNYYYNYDNICIVQNKQYVQILCLC